MQSTCSTAVLPGRVRAVPGRRGRTGARGDGRTGASDFEFRVNRAAATRRPGRDDQVVRVPSTALVLEYSARFGMRTT